MREWPSGREYSKIRWARSRAMMWTQGKSSLGLTHRASGASEAPQLLPTEAAGCSLHQLSVGHWPWAALEGLGCHFQSQGGSCRLTPTLRTREPAVWAICRPPSEKLASGYMNQQRALRLVPRHLVQHRQNRRAPVLQWLVYGGEEMCESLEKVDILLFFSQRDFIKTDFVEKAAFDLGLLTEVEVYGRRCGKGFINASSWGNIIAQDLEGKPGFFHSVSWHYARGWSTTVCGWVQCLAWIWIMWKGSEVKLER